MALNRRNSENNLSYILLVIHRSLELNLFNLKSRRRKRVESVFKLHCSRLRLLTGNNNANSCVTVAVSRLRCAGLCLAAAQDGHYHSNDYSRSKKKWKSPPPTTTVVANLLLFVRSFIVRRRKNKRLWEREFEIEPKAHCKIHFTISLTVAASIPL